MEFEIIDNYDVVTCRICGRRSKRIYGLHLKYHNITSEKYKELYPGAPLMAKVDTEKMGKHMRDDKYKKMFRDMYVGDKNPNHKSRTTEEERKSRSPFSKDFTKYKEVEDKDEVVKSFAKKALKDRVSPLQKEYYLNKGFTEQESLEILSNRQRTFSLEKCIEKYGEEKGLKRWKERQHLWQKNLLENGNIKCGYSKISQELFYNIINNYDVSELKDVYFSTKNSEFYISVKEKGFFVYDFCDKKRKKIIEYNGDYYHANPIMFNEYDKPHPYLKEKGPTSKEIWNKDKFKIDIANQNNFEVLTVWDSEYRKNKNSVIDKCLTFLGII